MATFDLRCQNCNGVFEWLFLKPNKSDGPKECPICRATTDGEDEMPDRLPAAPHIENIALNRAADYVYRADEEGSRHRAQVAAESFGMDAGAARSLITTDLGTRSTPRPGDVVAMPIQNDVSRMVASAPSNVVGHVAPSTAAAYAESAHSGPYAYQGAKARSATKSWHASKGGVVTDSPALEVVNRDRAIAAAPRFRARR